MSLPGFNLYLVEELGKRTICQSTDPVKSGERPQADRERDRRVHGRRPGYLPLNAPWARVLARRRHPQRAARAGGAPDAERRGAEALDGLEDVLGGVPVVRTVG